VSQTETLPDYVALSTPTPEVTPIPTPDPVTEHIGYLKEITQDSEGNLLVTVDEVIWVHVDDTELIQKYSLQDAPFYNDYEIVNTDPEMTLTANSDITMTALDSTYATAAKPTDYQTLSNQAQTFISNGLQGLVVTYLMQGDTLLEIHEMYTP